MAGQRIRVHATSLVMIHAPWMGNASGNALQLREHADSLDVVATTMAPAYRRSKQPDAAIAGWLDGRDHWFTADQLIALNLADEVIAERTDTPVFAACRHPIPAEILSRLQTAKQTMTTANTTPTTTATATPGPNPQPAAKRTIDAAADRQRRTDIRALGGKFTTWAGVPELLAQCEDDYDCTPDAAGLRMLAHMGKGSEPLGGHYVYREPADDNLHRFKAAATDAILQRGGVTVRDAHPAARDLRNTSILGMAERILSMHSRSTSGLSPSAIISAALSTSDFPALLGGAMQKSLKLGYSEAPATFIGWTAEREVANFRPQSLVSLSEGPDLLLVPELSEFKMGNLGESAESFALATYGRIIAISRQALINDDLSAFSSIPQLQGIAARRLESDSVYAKLNGNGPLSDGKALFHVDHGNTAIVGAALSAASLAVARASMRRQRGIGGQFIDPQPRFLIVPVALESLAESLVVQSMPGKALPTENAWISGLQVVADPRLDVASETAWYLATAPGVNDSIVRAYLAGEDRPALDERDGFVRDLREFKVRLDLAVGVIDYRGLYRNPGA